MSGLQTMTQPEAVLIAAIIAATVALVGSTITNIVALRSEAARHRESRQASYVKELRDRSVRVLDQLFAVQHELEWVTSHVNIDPRLIDSDMIVEYDKILRTAYAGTQSGLAALSAMDAEAAEKIKEKLDAIVDLEYKTATVLLTRRRKGFTPESVRQLKDIHREARKLGNSLPGELGAVMREAESRVLTGAVDARMPDRRG